MNLPSQIIYINPMLKTLQKIGKQATYSQVFEGVVEEMSLSKEKKDNLLNYESINYELSLHFAKYFLQRQKYMDSSLPELWALTAKGYAVKPFNESELSKIQFSIEINGEKTESFEEDEPLKPEGGKKRRGRKKGVKAKANGKGPLKTKAVKKPRGRRKNAKAKTTKAKTSTQNLQDQATSVN